MATQVSQNVPNLFKDLNRLGKDGDYEKALKVANKLLSELPDDEKVFQCKIVCLIQLGKYEDALQAIKKNQKFLGYMTLEKAFCEYRLNRCDEALKTINTGDLTDPCLKDLLGQLYYRTERYEESYDLYRDIIKNTQDDFEDERETNLSAVVAALQLWDGKECEGISLREETYEMCYNSGCRLIGVGAYAQALDKLKEAEEKCRATFTEEQDVPEDEINSELAIIWVQTGYVLQKLGRSDEALKLYNQVIKQKSSDAALMAVASNNIITINKEQNMFDSKKRIKTATSADLKNKLTTCQKRSIATNECLLQMYGGQAEQCKKFSKVLQGSAQSAVKGSLIEAAQLIREKNADGAIEFLTEQIKNIENQDVTDLKLALAQIYLNQEHVYKACDVLRSLGEGSYKPGILSTLVSLYLSQEDQEMAAEVLGEAVEWHLDNKPDSEDLMKLVQANANFHLTSGSPKIAAEMLEKMRKKNATDLKLLAQLILAYSKFDPKKAQEVCKEFPPPEKLSQDVDVDLLESSSNWLGSKWAKKVTKTEASPMSPKCKSVVVVKKKSKNKKKKVLPKNYDPNIAPDPERWLPLRERSTYKGKKKNKKRDVGRGTQGSVAAGASELDASEHQVNGAEQGTKGDGQGHPSPAGGVANINGPRQQKPSAAAAKQRPKKKKGARW